MSRDHFPTVVGTIWVYDTDTGDATLTLEGTRTIGGKECFVFRFDSLRRSSADSPARPATSKEFFAVTEAGVLGFGAEDEKKDDLSANPYPRIKFGTKAGDTWSYKRGNDICTFENLGEEEIEVPAGKYMAVKIRSNPRMIPPGGAGFEIKTTEWYAKGVGLVMNKAEVLGYESGMKLRRMK